MEVQDKICFIGDCHGKIDQLLSIIFEKVPPEVRKVQLGDMAIGFPGVEMPHIDAIKDNCWFRFIRGNHDWPEKCEAHPNYLGKYGYNPAMKMFWVGGAFSIDHEIRKVRMKYGGPPQWWEDEELSSIDLSNACKLYSLKKPEIMVTHEAPSSIGKELLTSLMGFRPEKFECADSCTALVLEGMFRLHQPKRWYFGHYHVDKVITSRGTRFKCLNELSYEIYDPNEEA